MKLCLKLRLDLTMILKQGVTMSKKCTFCGIEVEADFKYCKKCGSPVTIEEISMNDSKVPFYFNKRIILTGLLISAFSALILDTVIIELLYKLPYIFRFVIYFGTLIMYAAFPVFIIFLICYVNLYIGVYFERYTTLLISILLGVLFYVFFASINILFKAPIYNLINSDQQPLSNVIVFSDFLNNLNNYYNPKVLLINLKEYFEYFSINDWPFDFRLFMFVREILTGILSPLIAVFIPSIFYFKNYYTQHGEK